MTARASHPHHVHLDPSNAYGWLAQFQLLHLDSLRLLSFNVPLFFVLFHTFA